MASAAAFYLAVRSRSIWEYFHDKADSYNKERTLQTIFSKYLWQILKICLKALSGKCTLEGEFCGRFFTHISGSRRSVTEP